MKTFWFKVENGPADEVEVRNAENIKQLKQEIIRQHSNLLHFQNTPAVADWNLYKSAQAEEPADSWTLITDLGTSGETGPAALILKRAYAPGTQGAYDKGIL